jgi:prepilin-type N-terminal cleavage/methylation domain-containing protein
MRKKHCLNTSSSAGLTLIELMVTVTIMLLLLSGGVAAFLSFNDKQRVFNSVKEVQGYLRTAQTLSRVGETPDTCDRLNGYIVRSSDGAAGKEIKLIADCDNGEIEHKVYQLQTGITLASDIEVTFNSLYGGVSGYGDVTVTDGNNLTYQFSVTQGGEITQGDYL